jgi:hypothetical protein
MAMRLVRSGLAQPPVTRMKCGGYGREAEMEVMDRSTLVCPLCGTVNRWILVELCNRGWIAIGRPDAAD